jgi:hypothetical protein
MSKVVSSKFKSPEYNAWIHMKARCYNRKTTGFKNYGGRGIIVCERWKHSFENFFADMGKRPTNNHSLDRYPDKDGNYGPLNCRWATIVEQNNNQRSNVLIDYNGERITITELSRRVNLSVRKLFWYISDNGESVENAILLIQQGGKPSNKPVIAYDLIGNEIGKYCSAAEAARVLNCEYKKISAVCTGIYKSHKKMRFAFQ